MSKGLNEVLRLAEGKGEHPHQEVEGLHELVPDQFDLFRPSSWLRAAQRYSHGSPRDRVLRYNEVLVVASGNQEARLQAEDEEEVISQGSRPLTSHSACCCLRLTRRSLKKIKTAGQGFQAQIVVFGLW